jgi:hypothetical protein
LDDDDVSGRSRESRLELGTLPTVANMEEEDVDQTLLFEPSENLRRAVGGTVVHGDDLDLKRHLSDPPEKRFHGTGLVEHRHHH